MPAPASTRRTLLRAALALAAWIAGARPLVAQGGAVLQGEVVDLDTGVGIAAARVLVDGRPRAEADSLGRFQITGLSTGEHRLRVERLGYAPAEVVAMVADSMYLTISLAAEARELDGVNATAPVTPKAAGGIGGFEYRRRHRARTGRFITRAELDAESSVTLADVLRRLPGATIIHAPSGSGEYLATAVAPGAQALDRPPGEWCYALVFVDGTQMYGTVRGLGPDLNEFDVNELEAIEYYARAANAPPEFRTLSWDCGALVLWTRTGR